MNVIDANINGLKILEPLVYNDNRGLFFEFYNENTFLEMGIEYNFVQDNISTSVKGVLRGVHTQLRYPQAKIVSCLKGAIYDVAVDCRPDSRTLGQWHAELLDQNNHKMMLIPEGVAHGFYTIDDAMILMKVTTHYTPGDEIGFKWDDVSVGIDWPLDCDSQPILAEKDEKWASFRDMIKVLVDYR